MSAVLKIRRVAGACSRAALGVALGLGLCMGVVGAAPALARAAAPVAVTAPAEGTGPRLWVIRDEDSTLYLFGTVHILKPDTAWESDRVTQAFDSAAEIWFEAPNLDDQAAAIPLVQRHGFDPSRPLSSVLSAEDFASFDAAARSIGGSGAAFDAMRPWMAAMTLSLAAVQKAGYQPQTGVEMVLLNRARAAGKPVRGFETMDQQLRMLADMSDEAQLAFLKAAIKDFDDATRQLDGMVEAWRMGDMEALDALVGQELKGQSIEVYEAILSRRNLDWANQIQTMLEGSGTAFIAVGGGHLAGEDSVQAILERRGVTVSVAD